MSSAQPATAPGSRRTLANVQGLRAVAVLLVVGVHLGNPNGFERRYLDGEPLTAWLYLPGQAGVDLFFVISGLIMALTTWHLRHDAHEARAFLVRRAKRIYPMYWLVTVPLLLVWLVRPDLIGSSQEVDPKPIQSLLLLPQAGLPILPVGWSLVYEAWFYLLFAGALLAPKRWLLRLVAGWAAVTAALGLALEGVDVPPALALVSDPLCLEFAAGVAVGHLVMRRRPVAPLAALLVGAAAFVAVVTAGALQGGDEMSRWARGLALGPACALLVYGAVGLENARGLVVPRALQRLGDASYSVYLVHVVVLTALGRGLDLVDPPAALHVPLLAAGAVLCVAAGVVLHRVVERPLLDALGTRRHRAPTQEPEPAAVGRPPVASA